MEKFEPGLYRAGTRGAAWLCQAAECRGAWGVRLRAPHAQSYRDVAAIPRPGAEVRGGAEAGERPEVVDEMRLVVVAAGERDVRPVDVRRRRERAQDLLEAPHAAIELRREADLGREDLDESPRAEADAVRDVADRAHRGGVHGSERVRHRRVADRRSAEPREQRGFEDAEPGARRRRLLQALLQGARVRAPDGVQGHALVVQLVGRHPSQERKRATRPEVHAQQRRPIGRLDHEGLRLRATEDRAGPRAAQHDDQLADRPRQDPLARMARAVGVIRPEELDEPGQRRPWHVPVHLNMGATQHRTPKPPLNMGAPHHRPPTPKRVDLALQEPAEPAPVLRLQIAPRPVLAGDRAAAARAPAVTRHRVVAVVGRRPVVGQLLAGGDVAHGDEHDLALDRDVRIARMVRVEHRPGPLVLASRAR